MTVLKPAQQRRAEALGVARATLAEGRRTSKGFLSASDSSGTLPTHRSVVELIDLAAYVVADVHPFDREFPDDDDELDGDPIPLTLAGDEG